MWRKKKPGIQDLAQLYAWRMPNEPGSVEKLECSNTAGWSAYDVTEIYKRDVLEIRETDNK